MAGYGSGSGGEGGGEVSGDEDGMVGYLRDYMARVDHKVYH